MRFFFGLIVGAALTIGVAYVRDSTVDSGVRPMVNWDVVGTTTRSLGVTIREQWDKLTGK